MAIYGWDAITGEVAMPTVTGGVNSAPYTVPKGCRAVSFHVGALDGTTTCKVQALAPNSDVATESWADVSWYNPADGAAVAADGIPESAVTVINTELIGGGVQRLVASGAQTTLTTIKLVFHMRG